MTDVTTDDAERRLEAFLEEFDPEIAARAREARSALRAIYPGATELIFDNYNALVVGFGPSERSSEAVFSIALYPKWVRLFFLYGAHLDDPKSLLEGDGKQVRSLVVDDPAVLSSRDVRALLKQATEDCPSMRSGTGAVIVKSVSAKRRARRPARRGN